MSDISAIPSSPLPIATDMIRKAMTNVAGDAQVIADPQSAASQTVQALVDAKRQVLYTKAGATIISSTDRMVKSLLDTRA